MSLLTKYTKATELEFYDITDSGYYDILDNRHHDIRCKVELLDHNENAITTVEARVDGNDGGSVVANKEQGTRRSCSLTLINVDREFTIKENNFFWFNRKFKLYKGITDGVKTYWFSQGVFITQDSNVDSTSKTVGIQGVDKYALLDGTLNVLQADVMNIKYEIGATIQQIIKDTLMLDIGNGRPLDPIEPIIDTDIANRKIYSEYTLSAGSYYGDLMSEIMSAFNCDIYYDAQGRLRVTKIFNSDVAYFFAFKGEMYDFDYNDVNYQNATISSQLVGINKVTVSTDYQDEENVTYTAINNNPRSPLCYDKIGARVYTENGGIINISSGDSQIDTPHIKCKDYAEFYLMNETVHNLSVDFKCACVPHLREGDIITITDEDFGFDKDYFIIASITQPLNASEITISATNIHFLPTDISNDAIASSMIIPASNIIAIKYDINGGSGNVPTTQLLDYYSPFMPTIPTNASSKYTKADREFIGWSNYKSSESAKYNSSTESYSMPSQDTTLYAVWEDSTPYQFKVEFDTTSNLSAYTIPTIPCTEGEGVEYVITNGNKQYVYQFNPEIPEGEEEPIPVTPMITIPRSGSFTYTRGTTKDNWDNVNWNNLIMGQIQTNVIAKADGTSTNVKVTFPYGFPTPINTNVFSGCRITEVVLPRSSCSFISNTTGNNFLSSIQGLKEIHFTNDVTFKNYNTLFYCSDLENVTVDRNFEYQSGNYSIYVMYNNDKMNSVSLNNAKFTNGYYIGNSPLLKSVEFNGDLEIVCDVDNTNTPRSFCLATVNSGGKFTLDNFVVNNISLTGNTAFGYAMNFNCPVVVNGTVTADKYDVQYPKMFVQTVFNDSELTFKDSVDFKGGQLVYQGSRFANMNGIVTFEKDVSLADGSADSYYFTGTTGLTQVIFKDKTSLQGYCFDGCPQLTDAYFYSDDIDYGMSVFRDVGSGFKIHGVVADGKAKTLADMLGVEFELIGGE